LFLAQEPSLRSLRPLRFMQSAHSAIDSRRRHGTIRPVNVWGAHPVAEVTHPAVGGGQLKLSKHRVHAARGWFKNTASVHRFSGVTAGQAVRGPTPASWRASKSNGRAAWCPAGPADQGKGNENIGIVSPEMSCSRSATSWGCTHARSLRVNAWSETHTVRWARDDAMHRLL
jgi:hypothetical protein